jgi:hypothetical protein
MDFSIALCSRATSGPVQYRRGARRTLGEGRARGPLAGCRPPRGCASAALQIGAPPWESVTAIHEPTLAAAKDALGRRCADGFAEGRRLWAQDTVGTCRPGRPKSSDQRPLTARSPCASAIRP